jgi:hypothetical protein
MSAWVGSAGVVGSVAGSCVAGSGVPVSGVGLFAQAATASTTMMETFSPNLFIGLTPEMNVASIRSTTHGVAHRISLQTALVTLLDASRSK